MIPDINCDWNFPCCSVNDPIKIRSDNGSKYPSGSEISRNIQIQKRCSPQPTLQRRRFDEHRFHSLRIHNHGIEVRSCHSLESPPRWSGTHQNGSAKFFHSWIKCGPFPPPQWIRGTDGIGWRAVEVEGRWHEDVERIHDLLKLDLSLRPPGNPRQFRRFVLALASIWKKTRTRAHDDLSVHPFLLKPFAGERNRTRDHEFPRKEV